MNDSFLEDLELIPSDPKQATAYPVDRHVTTRNTASSLLQRITDSKQDNVTQRKTERPALTVSNTSEAKQTTVKEVNARDTKKVSESDRRKQAVKIKVSDGRERPPEVKLKSVENKVKPDSKEKESKDINKSKVQESRMKILDSKVTVKDRARRSGSYKENSPSVDISSKENSHPSDSSKESSSQIDTTRDKTKRCDCSGKKLESREKDPVALLNAIKELVSTYTKQESTKILRAMQDLHLNAQANLIKNLIFQTDELVKEIHPSVDSTRVKSLVEQNMRLQENVAFLQIQNEDLQKKLADYEVLKEENITLKMKCKELSKQ